MLHKVGVNSVEELSHADPKDLAEKLEAIGGEKVQAARIRIWIKGARHAVEIAAR